jgi:hypothetical protein
VIVTIDVSQLVPRNSLSSRCNRTRVSMCYKREHNKFTYKSSERSLKHTHTHTHTHAIYSSGMLFLHSDSAHVCQLSQAHQLMNNELIGSIQHSVMWFTSSSLFNCSTKLLTSDVTIAGLDPAVTRYQRGKC